MHAMTFALHVPSILEAILNPKFLKVQGNPVVPGPHAVQN